MDSDVKAAIIAYQEGKYEKAEAGFRQAAVRGNAEAQYGMGLLYMQGKALPRSCEEAARWFELSARQGHSFSEYNLAGLYARGQGVARDLPRAFKFYRSAAERGYAPAQYAVGLGYAQGFGVAKDREEAIRWWRLATAQGDASAKQALDLLLREMRLERVLGSRVLSCLRRYWPRAFWFLLVGGGVLAYAGWFFSLPLFIPAGLLIGVCVVDLGSEKFLAVPLGVRKKVFDYFFIYGVVLAFLAGQAETFLPVEVGRAVASVAAVVLIVLTAYQIGRFQVLAGSRKEGLWIVLWGFWVMVWVAGALAWRWYQWLAP